MTWYNYFYLYFFGFMFGLIGASWMATNPFALNGFEKLIAIMCALFGILCVCIANGLTQLEYSLNKKLRNDLRDFK